MPDLLIELLSEEIPARMQARAAEDLQKLVTNGVVEAGLTYAGARAFATPRRLALTVQGLTAESPTLREERRGPRVGAPDRAVEGFCASAGVTRDALEVRAEKKGEVYVANVVTPGRPAAEIVAEVLAETIRKFPWPKSMRWGSGDLRWVRPLQSILCLLRDEAGAEVVPLDVGGIVAGDRTRGHRFMAPETFAVTGFDDYAARLKRAFVVIDAEERAEAIWHAATNAAFAQGLEVVEDRALLSEIAGLVEWPVVLMGEIDPAFRHLPPEVLQTSMRTHQKFLSVRAPGGGGITHFITVANRETADDGATILAGNARVLAARLADARFFWDRDRAVAADGMTAWRAGLDAVTFHAKLGSQSERVARIEALAGELAPAVGAEPENVALAARIAKADLGSEMVGEFPELQGLMGRYYAIEAGFPEPVAAACEGHYAPLGPSDTVPQGPVTVAVALADKLDMLTGFWAIDERPTGSKDPFALRRAGLGVIRTLVENDLRVALAPVIWMHAARVYSRVSRVADSSDLTAIAHTAESFGTLPDIAPHLDDEFARRIAAEEAALPAWRARATALTHGLLAFLHDRLKVWLRDRGVPHDVIDACLAVGDADDLTALVRRAEALAAFLATEDGENLVQGFRRANNILTQAEAADGVEYSFGPDPKLAETAAETALFEALDREGRAISTAIEAEDLASAMRGMASLRPAVDAFFDTVQVNAENPILRRNRLNLLHLIRQTTGRVADLSRLSG